MGRTIKAVVFDCFGVLSIGTGKNIELIDYIKTLKIRGIKIGILSNITSDWITSEFLDKDEQQLFDDMVFSHKVHMIKPNPKIFELACSRLNVLPSEIVLVDDSDHYCGVAETLGMKTVQYINFDQTKTDIEEMLSSNNSN